LETDELEGLEQEGNRAVDRNKAMITNSNQIGMK
jgi:hypothetical protein